MLNFGEKRVKMFRIVCRVLSAAGSTEHARPHTAYDSNELNRRSARLWGLNAGGLPESRRFGAHGGRESELLGPQSPVGSRRWKRLWQGEGRKLRCWRSAEAWRAARAGSEGACSGWSSGVRRHDVSLKAMREDGGAGGAADGWQLRRGRRSNVSISRSRPVLHAGQ